MKTHLIISLITVAIFSQVYAQETQTEQNSDVVTQHFIEALVRLESKQNALEASHKKLVERNNKLEAQSGPSQDIELKKLYDKQARQQKYIEKRQTIYDAELALYEAKQLLLDSRLTKVELEAKKLTLLQEKGDSGKRVIQSELVFPETRGAKRDRLQKQLNKIIVREEAIDKEVLKINNSINRVNAFSENQMAIVDKLTKSYFDLKTSIKLN